MPLGGDQLVEFTSLLIEKQPGLPVGDYGYLLLSVHDVSDVERRNAEYLIRLDDAVKKVVDFDDEYMLLAKKNMLRIQNCELEMKQDELKERNPTPEQQAAYEKIAQLATNAIPAGFDPRGLWRFTMQMMKNYIKMALKSQVLTDDDKDHLMSLDKFLNILGSDSPYRGKTSVS